MRAKRNKGKKARKKENRNKERNEIKLVTPQYSGSKNRTKLFISDSGTIKNLAASVYAPTRVVGFSV